MKKSLYGRWCAMRNRCSNPRNPAFKHYGGRGIKVCDRWKSFEAFAADMGEPGPQQWLDRIDVNGDYAPENCRWASNLINGQNQRKTRMLTIHGRTQCAAAWERETGIGAATLIQRVKKGLPDADVTNPNLPRKTNKGKPLPGRPTKQQQAERMTTARKLIDSI